MKTLFSHIIFTFCCLLATAQQEIDFAQAEAVYKQIEAFYSKDQYNIKVQMKSYKGLSTNNLQDQSNGYVRKNKNEYESYQMGQYSIQNQKLKLVIDSSEKQIAITFPDHPINDNYSYESFMKSKLYIDKVTLKKGENKQLFTTHYKKGYYYSKMIMSVLSNGQIEYLKLFLADELEYKDQNGNLNSSKAWVLIQFYSLPIKKDFFQLSINSIIEKKQNGYLPTHSFKHFELTDLRHKH